MRSLHLKSLITYLLWFSSLDYGMVDGFLAIQNCLFVSNNSKEIIIAIATVIVIIVIAIVIILSI